MPLPAKRAENCSLAQLTLNGVNTDNLFNRKHMKGWWSAYDINQESTHATTQGIKDPHLHILHPTICVIHCNWGQHTGRSL